MDQAEKTPVASKQPLSERVAQILAEAKQDPKVEAKGEAKGEAKMAADPQVLPSQHKDGSPNKLIRQSKRLFTTEPAEPVTVQVTEQVVEGVKLRASTIAEMEAGRAMLEHHKEQHLAARQAQARYEASLNQQVETNREFIPNMSQRANPAG